MKKISYLELSSLVLTIIITFSSGININILKEDAGINSWIAIILSYVIGIIPLLLTLYISNYRHDLNIFEKNIILFGKYFGFLLNFFISLIFFVIGITLLYNIVGFITTQFLYHTPMIISSTLLVLLAIYCAKHEINVISHISLILTVINLIIFFTNSFSLISEVDIDNLLPILKTDTSNIITASIKIAIINTLPIILILIIPKDKITNKDKYNKAIIFSYALGALISLIIVAGTISVLGIYLVKAFEFSEYMVLKKVKLFGFLERIENIASIMWITETYIYLTLIIYSISKSIKTVTNDERKFIYSNIIVGLLLIIFSKYLFKNITIFNTYVKSTFIYIVSLLLIAYIVITIKVFLNKITKWES